MRVRIRGDLARKSFVALRAAHWATLLTGLGILSWPLFVTVESAFAQWSGERQLSKAASAAKEPAKETIVKKTLPSRPGTPRGSVLGRFEIPRLHLSYVLLEGTDDRTLDKSIGHVEGTSLVGESGNVSIAGHRNTHFRKVEWIRRGDEIVLTSPQGGKFRYRVEWMRLFNPLDVEVLDPSHGPAVTLITCFPFEYVGSAPLRFIVRALPDDETRERLLPGHPSSSEKPAED